MRSQHILRQHTYWHNSHSTKSRNFLLTHEKWQIGPELHSPIPLCVQVLNAPEGIATLLQRLDTRQYPIDTNYRDIRRLRIRQGNVTDRSWSARNGLCPTFL